jgi:hypothetical protein
MVDASMAGMSPSARSRVRSRLKRTSPLTLAPRLRGRAIIHHLRADPADLGLIADEPRLVLTGMSTAGVHEFDIVAPDALEAYLPASELRGLMRKYFLEPSARPNITFRVVHGAWPFPPELRIAPRVIAALDLLDNNDARASRAGKQALEELEAA